METANLPIIQFSKSAATLLIDGKYRKIEQIEITDRKIMITYNEKDITPANTLFVGIKDTFQVEGNY